MTKIKEIQLIEQNLQNYLSQKQQFKGQKIEVESALKAIETSKESYQIIGNIMVQKDSSVLKDELEEKKKILDIRIKSIEKNEEKLREKVKELQNEVLEKKRE